jgi:hypothetical protein
MGLEMTPQLIGKRRLVMITSVELASAPSA